MDLVHNRSLPQWSVLLVPLAYWLACSRLLSPQWSVYVQYNYGWAVPFLCGYLLWLRWVDRPQIESYKSAAPLLAILTGALLLLPTRIIVEANPIWRVGSWAMTLEILAITLALVYIIGGKSWVRHFGFPFAFFLVAVPWPSQWENAIVQSLMSINTGIVVEILANLGIPAIQHGNVIEISRGLVGVDEACSGIRSLQATLMISLFFGELYRLTIRKRIALIAAGAGIAFICNVIRTFLLVWVSSRSGLEAMEKWHDPTGIGILLACFTLLWLVATKLRRPITNPNPTEAPAAPALKLRWLPYALCLWLVVLEVANASWFGMRDQARPDARNWAVRWPVEKEKFHEVKFSQQVLAELRYQEGKSAGWSEADGTVWQMFHFRWGPAHNLLERVQVQCAKAHRPERCLPASGRELKEDRGLKMFPVGDLQLPFRAFRFEDQKMPLYVYFCAWEDGTTGAAAQMRENVASRLAAAKTGSRSISQRILEIAVWGNLSNEQADAALNKLLQETITP